MIMRDGVLIPAQRVVFDELTVINVDPGEHLHRMSRMTLESETY